MIQSTVLVRLHEEQQSFRCPECVGGHKWPPDTGDVGGLEVDQVYGLIYLAVMINTYIRLDHTLRND